MLSQQSIAPRTQAIGSRVQRHTISPEELQCLIDGELFTGTYLDVVLTLDVGERFQLTLSSFRTGNWQRVHGRLPCAALCLHADARGNTTFETGFVRLGPDDTSALRLFTLKNPEGIQLIPMLRALHAESRLSVELVIDWSDIKM